MRLMLWLLSATTATALSTSCGQTVYSQEDLDDAIDQAIMTNNNPSTFGGRYPHRFGNRENVQFPNCDTGTSFVLYPLKQGSVYDGGKNIVNPFHRILAIDSSNKKKDHPGQTTSFTTVTLMNSVEQ